ncbi:hypothetical protein [Streptomyces antarcticus]|uniref:hypothetical protein n=1 Tax=Streptomyces antarcticus TaxID=2996458 RepID=UPI002270C089|nr:MULTISPECIES: hypothetical protein [unclassified Streptomyces]MCY0940237.1 hypothetical protein [Streptomyces sp. H34-AA3]MCZ4080884.1 hypothetical protein [Streptomyces sp. H34-S5]
MPDHRNVLDPSWQRAWARFAHVTTPLRERGLVCDVQYGMDDWLVYAWPPGHDSVVLIGAQGGWLATHEAPAEDRTSMTVLYDSTDSVGPHDVGPLLSAIDALLARLPRIPSTPVAARVHAAGVHAPPPATRGTRSR